VDGVGTFYIADEYNNRVHMVSSDTITTVAGNGTIGYRCNNDGAQATSIGLHNATGVAVTGAAGPLGAFYVADYGNQCIRALITPKPLQATSEMAPPATATAAGQLPTPN
jgi:nicotinamide mononucleotide (NMN) deamidase PncC